MEQHQKELTELFLTKHVRIVGTELKINFTEISELDMVKIESLRDHYSRQIIRSGESIILTLKVHK